MSRHTCIAFGLLLGLAISSAVLGDPKPTGKAAPKVPVAAPKAPVKAQSIPIAILDFDANTPGSPDLGTQIGEALNAMIGGEKGITLVDRAILQRALQELELNQSGLVNPDQAAKIGKLVGAKILVTGKAFMLDRQLFITAKLVGTETSLVEGVIVKGEKDAEMGQMIIGLAEKVSTKLREAGPRLVATEDAIADPLPALKAKLKERKLPVVSVVITERHVPAANARAIDPAVETEIKLLLTQSGFTVIEGDEKQRVEAGVELIISGEAFSEFNARIGNLISCSGRVEVKIKTRKDEKVVFVDRATVKAVELSEQIAGKSALQKAGREIGLRLLAYFAENLPAGVDAPKKD